MIPLIAAGTPGGGKVALLTSTIGGVISDIRNAKHCVVYTDTFPDGITVDMPIEEFYDVWLGSLLSELEVVEISAPTEVH